MNTTTKGAPRRGHGGLGWPALCLAALLATGERSLAQGPGPDSSVRPDEDSAALKEARAALKEVASLKNTARGQETTRRAEILEQAGRRYEEVAARYPAVPEVGGEAWFRAGEIWRVLRRLEQAERCFVTAVAVEANPGFGARSLLEIAHLRRRAEELEAALKDYQAVEDRFPKERRAGVQARTWQGKVLLQQGEIEEGHRRLLSVAQSFPEFPVESIRNADTVAVAWCKSERVAEARKLVEQVRATYAEEPKDEKLRAAVVQALSRMKAPALIEKATGDSNGSGGG